ncbi:uncharacterized protein [Nicotiana sylvestris]|uniref:uncharacterized protein isoform X2 n=1 Tax=Nicotiana sylvestris TaxID=4096 RepID=UPI00388C5221
MTAHGLEIVEAKTLIYSQRSSLPADLDFAYTTETYKFLPGLLGVILQLEVLAPAPFISFSWVIWFGTVGFGLLLAIKRYEDDI